MNISPAIINRIQELGGNVPSNNQSLKEFLLGTTFPHYLYRKDWDFYGVDDFLDKNRTIFQKDVNKFVKLVEQHYFAKHDFACGQDFWKPELFTPLTPGTPDFNAWQPWFTENSNLSSIRALCGDGLLEFFQIIHSYGYPDHYYICLQDPVPENPTVFGTDHEVYFQEVCARATLLDFLHSYCTRNDFCQIVSEYISSKT
jgi:hypothetical protein